MKKFDKTFLLAATLIVFSSTFTACNSNKLDSDLESLPVTEVTTEEATTELPEDTGIFVDFNEGDYSVDMTFEEIYHKNGISTEKIENAIDPDSSLYYEIDLKITSEDIEVLQDSSGVYVAELDLETCEIKSCGDSVASDNTDTEVVLIMFGDRKLMDTECLTSAFNIDSSTRTLLIKGVFRGHTALYPMLVENSDGNIYIFKPFLEMSKTW